MSTLRGKPRVWNEDATRGEERQREGAPEARERRSEAAVLGSEPA